MNPDNDSAAMQDVIDNIRDHFGVESAILVLKDGRGFNASALSGIASHQDAVLLLAGAMHMVLLGHDQAVLQGAAGADAQAVAESLQN